jgi:hypothetical protein
VRVLAGFDGIERSGCFTCLDRLKCEGVLAGCLVVWLFACLSGSVEEVGVILSRVESVGKSETRTRSHSNPAESLVRALESSSTLLSH